MGYVKPLKRGIARGQRFGANPGWGPNPAGGHNGDDYLSFPGELVHAAGDGVVIHAGTFDSTYADNFGWNLNFGGNMVVLNLDGAAGPYVEYGHLEQIHVRPGDRVRRGQVIATTGATDGNTGVITGAHLHVGVLPPGFNLNTNTYGRVDPDLYLTDHPDTLTPASASKDWFDMATRKDLMDAFHEELKTPRTRRLIQDIVWTQSGGKRAGKAVTMWRDVVDTNTLLRTVLASVQDLGVKIGKPVTVSSLDADAVVDAIAERLNQSAVETP